MSDVFINVIWTNWITPIITAIISGLIVYYVQMYKKNPLKKFARRKKEYMILDEYCRSKDVVPIVSYGDSSAITTATMIQRGNVTLKADLNLQNCPKNNEKRNFVMALLKYIPPCDWSSFASRDYVIEFTMRVSQNIKGVQLEIKDPRGSKIMDEFVQAEEKELVYTSSLAASCEGAGWKQISEICFVIFTEEQYIDGINGHFEISDFKLASGKH